MPSKTANAGCWSRLTDKALHTKNPPIRWVFWFLFNGLMWSRWNEQKRQLQGLRAVDSMKICFFICNILPYVWVARAFYPLSLRTSWDLSLRTSFVKQSKLLESQERLNLSFSFFDIFWIFSRWGAVFRVLKWETPVPRSNVGRNEVGASAW